MSCASAMMASRCPRRHDAALQAHCHALGCCGLRTARQLAIRWEAARAHCRHFAERGAVMSQLVPRFRGLFTHYRRLLTWHLPFLPFSGT